MSLTGFLFVAATPKQIREKMQVDGLTNDEVKSHLQVSDNISSQTPNHPWLIPLLVSSY